MRKIGTLIFLILPTLVYASLDSFLTSLEHFTQNIEIENYSRIGTIMIVKDTDFIPSSFMINKIDSLLSKTGSQFLTIENTSKYIHKLKLSPSQLNDSLLFGKIYDIDGFLVLGIEDFELNHFSYKFFDVKKSDFTNTTKTYSILHKKEVIQQKYQKIYLSVFGGGIWFLFGGEFYYGGEVIFLPSKNIGLSICYQKGYTGWGICDWEEVYYNKLSGRLYLLRYINLFGVQGTDFFGLGGYWMPYDYYKHNRFQSKKTTLGVEVVYERYWKIGGLRFGCGVALCAGIASATIGSGINIGLGF